MIEIYHNIDASRFVWLWAKYVTGCNDKYHCTNSLRGLYSKRFSKHNPDLSTSAPIQLDEQPAGSFAAVYICGVAKNGYLSKPKRNYPHNLHAVIVPAAAARDQYNFENWQLSVHGGKCVNIPAIEDIPSRYRNLPPDYTSCRIFRWAVSYFEKEV